MKELEKIMCSGQPELNKLTASIDLLSQKIEQLLDLHRVIIRWLLVVVCVIALGRSAIDLGHGFLKDVASANAEEISDVRTETSRKGDSSL